MPIRELNRANLEAFNERFARLRPETPRKWGTMTPARMMRHLRYMAEISLGEVPVKDHSNVLTRTILRVLFFHLITRWPTGRIKAPAEFTPEPDGDFEAERALLLSALERFTVAQEAAPDRAALHPILGPQTRRYWGRLHGVHFEHHFRQFGI